MTLKKATTFEHNYRRIDLKRKVFTRGNGGDRRKRFKKTPKFIKDNIENQVAKETKQKDIFDFSDDDDFKDDFGMGLELSDLPFLDGSDDQHKGMIALSQDSVRPLYANDSEYTDDKILEALQDLRFTSFKPNQKEAIKRILFGRSTLFISPTGSGKSLCYQLPALLYWRYRKYITIVVSPLISLMQDQLHNFPSSLRAVCLHFGQTKIQRNQIIKDLVTGEAQVVFMSPEAIVGGILNLKDFENFPPVGFVCIDEAHCLSEWSHNFRPAYFYFFNILRQQLNIKTFLGLTATASQETIFTVARCLTLNPERDVIGKTLVPENLILSASIVPNREKALIDLLKSPTFRVMPSIIVYCNTRIETENVASVIRTAMQSYSSLVEKPERIRKSHLAESPEKETIVLTWDAKAYHAGLTADTRRQIQRQFIKGELRVVVATVAFGLGINKANIRAIIHYDMPSSFESYVQEVGRAGRDGKHAQCHVLLRSDKSDVAVQQRNIYASTTERKNVRKLVEHIFRPYDISCRCHVTNSKEDIEKCARLNKLAIDSDKTLVRKHRACKGHEIAVGLDQISEEVDLTSESIITLICQIQKAYPQLNIEQYNTLKPTCNVFCGKGSQQMLNLQNSCPPVRDALNLHRRNFMKAHGPKARYEVPRKLSFNIVLIAHRMAKPINDVIKMLRKIEWELVEQTGRFRRTQIRVKFEDNAFHLKTALDIADDELDEMHNFVVDYMRKYEIVERNKVAHVYNTFNKFSIDQNMLHDKIARFQGSINMKKAIDLYFNPAPMNDPTKDKIIPSSPLKLVPCEHVGDTPLTESQEKAIRASVRAFITAHTDGFTPRNIAKIFQGISSPKFPSEHWGPNRKWWRIHPDVDFYKLVAIISEELTTKRL